MSQNVVPAVNVRFDDPHHSMSAQLETLLTRSIQAGVQLDASTLQVHSGAAINIMVHADPFIPEVASSPSAWVATATPGVVQSAAEVVINTGHQPITPHPWQDGDLQVNVAFLQNQVFLDQHPTGSPNAVIPADKVDGVSLFAHEGLHILGMGGFLDQQASSAPAVAPTTLSNFDALVNYGPSGPSFTGHIAEAQNGGAPIELTAGDLYHVGDVDAFAYDLMNGDHIYTGWRYQPSALDEAILADLGFTPKPSDHLLAGYV